MHETNRRLHALLGSMISNPGESFIATPEHMAALLSELLSAGKELRAEPLPAKGCDPEFDVELDRYHRLVEQLRDLLPSIHRQLLEERTRLEAQRARAQSAAEWARASRQTL